MGTLGGWLRRIWRENWLFFLTVGGIATAFLVLRTPSSGVSSLAELELQLGQGQPTLVELYSNT